MLFLLAAGLTLVFGIMDMINLAHGSLYMVGAFLAAWFVELSGSFLARRAVGDPGHRGASAWLLEATLLRTLYARDHLSQVLATFALILIINDGVRMIWGTDLPLSAPAALAGPVEIAAGTAVSVVPAGDHPGAALALAVLLYLLVARTRLGALVRAGASNREMAMAMGVDIRRLFTVVFGIGAALCAVAGALLGPLFAVQVGMGESILILAFVVIVIGGIGSIRGALFGIAAGRHGRHLRPDAASGVLFGELPAAADGQRHRPGDRLGHRLPPHGSGSLHQAAGAFSGTRMKAGSRTVTTTARIAIAAVALVLVAFPWVARLLDADFYISTASRIGVFAIAATSLNLILGYGGLVSFGHAAFVGVGAYTVGVMIDAGIVNGWLGFAAAMLVAAALSPP